MTFILCFIVLRDPSSYSLSVQGFSSLQECLLAMTILHTHPVVSVMPTRYVLDMSMIVCPYDIVPCKSYLCGIFLCPRSPLHLSFLFLFLFLFFSFLPVPPPQIWYQTNLSPPTKLFLNSSGTQFTPAAPPILQIPTVPCPSIVVSKILSLQ